DRRIRIEDAVRDLNRAVPFRDRTTVGRLIEIEFALLKPRRRLILPHRAPGTARPRLVGIEEAQVEVARALVLRHRSGMTATALHPTAQKRAIEIYRAAQITMPRPPGVQGIIAAKYPVADDRSAVVVVNRPSVTRRIRVKLTPGDF